VHFVTLGFVAGLSFKGLKPTTTNAIERKIIISDFMLMAKKKA
jgi:hypothetical protein